MTVQQPVPGQTPISVEVGVCNLCGQELLRTADDCWHPYNVARACPPEPPSGSPEWSAWAEAGNRTGRPGREHWRPAVAELPEDLGCCALDDDHGGVCAWRCPVCIRPGTCPVCEGDGTELGCIECDSSGSCPQWCDDGWVSDDR